MFDRLMGIPEIDGDSNITLPKLQKLIPKLQAKYGKNAKLSFYAGYNNVEVCIEPSKKIDEENNEN